MKFPHPLQTVRNFVDRLFTALDGISGHLGAQDTWADVLAAEVVAARSDLSAIRAELQSAKASLTTQLDGAKADLTSMLQCELTNLRLTVNTTAHAVGLVHSHQLGHSAEPGRVPPPRS